MRRREMMMMMMIIIIITMVMTTITRTTRVTMTTTTTSAKTTTTMVYVKLFDTELPMGFAFRSFPGFRTPVVFIFNCLICQAMLTEW